MQDILESIKLLLPNGKWWLIALFNPLRVANLALNVPQSKPDNETPDGPDAGSILIISFIMSLGVQIPLRQFYASNLNNQYFIFINALLSLACCSSQVVLLHWAFLFLRMKTKFNTTKEILWIMTAPLAPMLAVAAMPEAGATFSSIRNIKKQYNNFSDAFPKLFGLITSDTQLEGIGRLEERRFWRA